MSEVRLVACVNSVNSGFTRFMLKNSILDGYSTEVL